MPSSRTFAGASTILVPTYRPSRGLGTRSLNWPWSCDTDPSGSVHLALTSANATVPVKAFRTTGKGSADTPYLSVARQRQRPVLAAFEQLGECVLQERQRSEPSGRVGDDLREQFRIDLEADPLRGSGDRDLEVG